MTGVPIQRGTLDTDGCTGRTPGDDGGRDGVMLVNVQQTPGAGRKIGTDSPSPSPEGTSRADSLTSDL